MSITAGEGRKQAWPPLQPLGSSGQTLWQVCNCGNEERWNHSMKGHCFGLKCMNSCCYYAWFFGFAGARRFFCKAYSLVFYINICKVAHEACQNHRELQRKKVIIVLYFLIIKIISPVKNCVWIPLQTTGNGIHDDTEISIAVEPGTINIWEEQN